MAANTFAVLGKYIPTDCTLIFLGALYGILWTEDYAVVAFEAESAAHAAGTFGLGLFLGEAFQPLLVVA
jgi:hypothetical protein